MKKLTIEIVFDDKRGNVTEPPWDAFTCPTRELHRIIHHQILNEVTASSKTWLASWQHPELKDEFENVVGFCKIEDIDEKEEKENQINDIPKPIKVVY